MHETKRQEKSKWQEIWAIFPTKMFSSILISAEFMASSDDILNIQSRILL